MRKTRLVLYSASAIVAAVVVLLACLSAFSPRHVPERRIQSWSQVGKIGGRLSAWEISESARVVGIQGYREDRCFVEGKSPAESIEQFVAQEPHLFLYRESHSGLHGVLAEAAKQLDLAPAAVGVFKKMDTWFVHGSVDGRIFITMRYDPVSHRFLAEIRARRGGE